jgi:hypothetical protein
MNIDKAMQKTEINGKNSKVYIIEILVTGNAKRIIISNKDNGEKKIFHNNYFEQLLKKTCGRQL